ncbi:MAG: hypothetical protein K2N86_00595 [Rikenellaceae bacterium]|nr:hypothetical protein [Rikenellaceae bacterium]MDE7355849.1 hypothetical protein [Rikenellaceae bacterium]
MVLKWIKAITEWLCRFPRLRREYIEVGGLKWALQNAGTDAENPGGRLYTWKEAIKLESDEWRLPTRAELEEFLKDTFFGFDEERKVGIFVDRKTGARLKLPAAGYLKLFSTLEREGERGEYWSLDEYDSNGVYYMYFFNEGFGVYDNDKSTGNSVRLVRR